MISKILAIVGVVFVSAGLAPIAHAQNVQVRAQEEGVTLSGESLRGVQGRSISEIYPSSTSESSISPQPSTIGNVSVKPNQQGVEVSDRVDFVVEEGSRRGTVPNLLLTEVAGDRDQRVKVQYRLTED